MKGIMLILILFILVNCKKKELEPLPPIDYSIEIKGIVLNKKTNAPIKNITVSAHYWAMGMFWARTSTEDTTDDQGYFELYYKNNSTSGNDIKIIFRDTPYSYSNYFEDYELILNVGEKVNDTFYLVPK